MAKRKNSSYWEKRITASEESKEAKADRLSKATARAYRKSYNRLTKEINALYAEILDRGGLENITRTELYNLTHWSRIRAMLTDEIEGLARDDAEKLTSLLVEVAMETFGVDLSLFTDEFNQLSREEALAIVNQNWSGQLFSERIYGNAEAFNARVLEDLEALVIGGYPPEKLKRQIMKDYNTHYYEADRLIRTEASNVFNRTAVEAFRKGGCTRIQYLAERDCCDLCRPYSGKVYYLGTEPYIPAHPNCRCTWLPVIDF